MLEQIKNIVFIYENDLNDMDSETDFATYDDSEDSHQLCSDTFLVKRKGSEKYFIGRFSSCHYYQYQSFEGCTIIDFMNENVNRLFEDRIESKVYFQGQDGDEGNDEDINVEDIVFLMPLDSNISLSNAINNDLEQPKRAIYNYFERELENTVYKDDPIDFCQNIIDVAKDLKKMYKEGSHIV